MTRRVFVALLIGWMLLPFVLWRSPAQDAEVFVSAGRLVAHGQVAHLYPDDHGCGDACIEGAPFVSAPAAAPFAAPLAALPTRAGVLAVRLFGAVCLAGAFALLWRRFPDRGVALTTIALLVTPLAYMTIGFGQDTPLLVLLAAVPLSALDGRRAAVGVGVALGVITAFKVFPVALIAVAFLAGRRVVALTACAVVAVSSAVMIGVQPSIVHDFAHGVATWDHVMQTNGSMSGSIADVAGPVGELGAMVVAAWLVAWTRRVPDDAWAAVAVATIVVWPQGWSHYLVVCVVALFVLSNGHRAVPVLLPGLLAALTVGAASGRPSFVAMAFAAAGVACLFAVHDFRLAGHRARIRLDVQRVFDLSARHRARSLPPA